VRRRLELGRRRGGLRGGRGRFGGFGGPGGMPTLGKAKKGKLQGFGRKKRLK